MYYALYYDGSYTIIEKNSDSSAILSLAIEENIADSHGVNFTDRPGYIEDLSKNSLEKYINNTEDEDDYNQGRYLVVSSDMLGIDEDEYEDEEVLAIIESLYPIPSALFRAISEWHDMHAYD